LLDVQHLKGLAWR